MYTAEDFTAMIDENKISPVFALLDETADNEIFIDGLFDGYTDFYDTTSVRPEPFTAQNLCQFFNKILNLRVNGIEDPDFLNYWELGYIAGWSLGLGESNPDLFHQSNHSHRWIKESYGSFNLASVLQGVELEILTRKVMFAYAKSKYVEYAVCDRSGIFVLKATIEGITCTCGQPDCDHARVIARLEPKFGELELKA